MKPPWLWPEPWFTLSAALCGGLGGLVISGFVIALSEGWLV